jgi:DNA-binding response OmpR family regulator
MSTQSRYGLEGAGRRILVVEDDRSLAVLITYMLSSEGYDVSSIGDGAAALEAIRTLKPSLIVLDLGLPGLSGDEICRAIRADPELADTFVLVLTALEDQEARRRVRSAGADCYMCKPFDPDRVVRLVEDVFTSGRLQRNVPLSPEVS